MSRRTRVDVSDRERVRIAIQDLKLKGVRQCDIIRMGYSRSLVKTWYNRDSFKDKKGKGRKSKLTAEIKQRIENEIKGKVGIGTRTVAKVLAVEFQEEGREWVPKRSTIKDYVKSTTWGCKSYHLTYHLRKRPFLSEKNKDDRRNFCKHVLDHGYLDPEKRGQEKRSHILFTDESLVQLHPTINTQRINTQNMQVRCQDYESDYESVPVNQVLKNSVSVMIAGGICSGGKTDLIIMSPDTKLSGKYYRQHILPVYLEFMNNKQMFPKLNLITYLQDGAPAHSDKNTLEILRNHIHPPINVWAKGLYPANSCDFNVIEHVWSIIKKSVFLDPRPTNRQQLITRIKSTWDGLDVDYLFKLSESFPARIAESALNDGGHTSYLNKL